MTKPVAVLIAEASAKSSNLNLDFAFHCHDCVLPELRAGESKILDNTKKRARIIRGSRQAVARRMDSLNERFKFVVALPVGRRLRDTASRHSHLWRLSREGICVVALMGHFRSCARDDFPKKPLEEAAVRGHSFLRRRLRRCDDILRGAECCKR